jgi:hypothetical protein
LGRPGAVIGEEVVETAHHFALQWRERTHSSGSSGGSGWGEGFGLLGSRRGGGISGPGAGGTGGMPGGLGGTGSAGCARNGSRTRICGGAPIPFPARATTVGRMTSSRADRLADAGPLLHCRRPGRLSGITHRFDDLAAAATVWTGLIVQATGAVACAANVLGRLGRPRRCFIPRVSGLVCTTSKRLAIAIAAHPTLLR